jgi:hypothetical protein
LGVVVVTCKNVKRGPDLPCVASAWAVAIEIAASTPKQEPEYDPGGPGPTVAFRIRAFKEEQFLQRLREVAKLSG